MNKATFFSILVVGAILLISGAKQVVAQANLENKSVVKPQASGKAGDNSSKAKTLNEAEKKERMAAFEKSLEKRRAENAKINAGAMKKAEESSKEREVKNRAAMAELKERKKDSLGAMGKEEKVKEPKTDKVGKGK
jgi:hypothetical protein